jgi:hypothetical protein
MAVTLDLLLRYGQEYERSLTFFQRFARALPALFADVPSLTFGEPDVDHLDFVFCGRSHRFRLCCGVTDSNVPATYVRAAVKDDFDESKYVQRSRLYIGRKTVPVAGPRGHRV